MRPLRLSQTSNTKYIQPDMFCRVASEMAMVHNMAIRGLNSIYLQAPYVAAPDSRSFARYMLAWHALLHVHHSGEEAHFFPAVEAMSGEAGAMEANVAQHRAFHDGLDGFRAYAEACAAGREEFDGGKVVGIIDGFGEVLAAHLREEIDTLLGLRRFGPEKMAELEKKFGEDGEKSMVSIPDHSRSHPANSLLVERAGPRQGPAVLLRQPRRRLRGRAVGELAAGSEHRQADLPACDVPPARQVLEVCGVRPHGEVAAVVCGGGGEDSGVVASSWVQLKLFASSPVLSL